MDRKGAGGASIAAGALILALSIIFITLTAMGIVPNQAWGVTQITNYVLCCFGLLVGLIVLGYGVYLEMLSGKYLERIESLERERSYHEEMLRRKEAELQLVSGKLRAAHRRIEGKKKQLLKVSGRLGDRTRRLKEIARLARVARRKR